MTRPKPDAQRLPTGVDNLDALVAGGVPRGSVTVLGGPPGTGKTILAQQICFHNATPARPVLYFNTLSEPTAKTLRYLASLSFFDAKKLGTCVHFVDLGVILRRKGLEGAAQMVMERVKQLKPAIVVIDSFRVFEDLASSREELRKFGYELGVSLMAWETTTFLLGEYGRPDIDSNPLFSIIDGLIMVSQREESGEHQRFLQIVKMRGTSHSRDEHSFVISERGIEVFAPRVTIQRGHISDAGGRCQTGISRLDDLLGDGIPRGSSLLIAGVAGTGKTVLLLEFLYRGAQRGEKGIIFSFEETPERLLASARGFGWDLEREVARGMIEIVFIPQPNIHVEEHLLMMQKRVAAMKARRVAVDSISVFLHKVRDPQLDREKVFQLASIVQNSQAVGFFATDIPYGANQLSRFGVEETVVDGVILLSSTEEGLDRHRYLEIYKLRNTAHLKGRHVMVIGAGGISVFPRYAIEPIVPPPLEPSRRLSSGVPGLDELCGGGLLERSVTLVSGSAGIGKSTLALQFIAEGARHKQPGLYVALEEEPAQLRKSAEALGIVLAPRGAGKQVDFLRLAGEAVRPGQFLSLLEDQLRAGKRRRLVIDGVGQMLRAGEADEDLRQLLVALTVSFKALGVTTILTLEARSMFAVDTITERGFSPIADNIVMLRYQPPPSALRPTLSVVKTRGSEHDRGTYFYSIARGGIHIDGPAGDGEPSGAPAAKRKR